MYTVKFLVTIIVVLLNLQMFGDLWVQIHVYYFVKFWLTIIVVKLNFSNVWALMSLNTCLLLYKWEIDSIILGNSRGRDHSASTSSCLLLPVPGSIPGRVLLDFYLSTYRTHSLVTVRQNDNHKQSKCCQVPKVWVKLLKSKPRGFFVLYLSMYTMRFCSLIIENVIVLVEHNCSGNKQGLCTFCTLLWYVFCLH